MLVLLYIYIYIYIYIYVYTVRSQKNGAVSEINKKSISHLTRAKRTPSAAATVPVSHALPAVRFHAYCGAVGSVSKMAPQQEKVFCVLRFEVFRSVITVQREFRARFRKDAPHRNNITRWYRQFVETGCLCKVKRPGRPRVSDDNIEFVYRVDVCRVTQGAHIEGL